MTFDGMWFHMYARKGIIYSWSCVWDEITTCYAMQYDFQTPCKMLMFTPYPSSASSSPVSSLPLRELPPKPGPVSASSNLLSSP